MTKTVPQIIEALAAKIAVSAQTVQMQEVQLKMFPDWPDDRRGAPNPVVRSAIFGVRGRGKRKHVLDMPIAGPDKLDIRITGWTLDQHDCDLWFEVHHLARNGKPGDPVRFTMYSMLRRLGHPKIGKSDYAWLGLRLKQLSETTISFKSESREGVVGNLLLAFELDHVTGEGVAWTNPRIRSLFEDVTHLNIEQRRALGSNQLAKALHAVISTHREWPRMRIDTLMQRVGADYGRLRDFKRELKAVLSDFEARGWIKGFGFTAGFECDIVEIEINPTPSQQRSLARQRSERE